MFDPWEPDATQWTDDDIERLKAFGDVETLEFCKPRDTKWDRRGKCILIGRKGLGKSFLLAYRSHNHRAFSKAATFFHPYGGEPQRLVEKLTSMSGAIPSNHWLRSEDSVDTWSAVWQVALLGLFVWRLDISLAQSEDYDRAFYDAENLGKTLDVDLQEAASGDSAAIPVQWFLGRVVEALPPDREECKEVANAMLYRASSSWAMAIRKKLTVAKRRRLAIYLDNPDELIGSDDGNPWINVQQGLVIAIWKLQKGGVLNDALNVYASVRSEAFAGRRHGDLEQALGLAIELRYDKTMLKNLFCSLINLTDESKLIANTNPTTDPIAALCGFTKYTHSDRRYPDGQAIEELVIEACLRHTRLVPRDIVAIGKAIVSIVPPSARTTEKIRAAVNAAAAQIVKYVHMHCYPPWKTLYDQFLHEVDSQVVEGTHLRQIAEKFSKGKAEEDPIRFLVGLGLLGYSEHNPHRHRHYFSQSFATVDQHGDRFEPNLKSQWYFLHPALKEWVRANRNGTQWQSSSNVLVGDSLPFEPRSPLIRLLVQSAATQASSPLRFLFLALWAWKLRGGDIPATPADIKSVATALQSTENFGASLHFPPLEAKPEKLQQWAKKINQFDALKRLIADGIESDAVAGGVAPREKLRRRGGDRRRTGFISISAPTIGVAPTVTFPWIRADDIYIDETTFRQIRLT